MSAPKNITASIQERLRNEARTTKVAYNTLLEHFALARFLARLSQSAYANRFVLKGAQLFTPAFFENAQKKTQWQAFLRKNTLTALSLEDVTEIIQSKIPKYQFLIPNLR